MAPGVDFDKIKMQKKNQSPNRRRKKGKENVRAKSGDAAGSGGGGVGGGGSTKDIARHLLKTLGKDLYQRIVEMFQIDFDLFGYPVTSFFEL